MVHERLPFRSIVTRSPVSTGEGACEPPFPTHENHLPHQNDLKGPIWKFCASNSILII
jgi:hypothetical protein